jgi:hypothetical protein
VLKENCAGAIGQPQTKKKKERKTDNQSNSVKTSLLTQKSAQNQ